MYPFLREGDILWVERVPLEEIRRGNVIMYKRDRGERSVVHRVVRILQILPGRLSLITKGDNVFTPDEPISSDLVMGKVMMRLRKGSFTSITRRREFTSFVLAFLYLKIRRIVSSLKTFGRTLHFPSKEGKKSV